MLCAAARPPQVFGCSQVGFGESSVPGSPRVSEAAASDQRSSRGAPQKHFQVVTHLGGGNKD